MTKSDSSKKLSSNLIGDLLVKTKQEPTLIPIEKNSNNGFSKVKSYYVCVSPFAIKRLINGGDLTNKQSNIIQHMEIDEFRLVRLSIDEYFCLFPQS